MSAKWIVILALSFVSNEETRIHALCPTATERRRSRMPSLSTSPASIQRIKRVEGIRTSPIQSYLSSTACSSPELGQDNQTTTTPETRSTHHAQSTRSAATSTATTTPPPELHSVDVRYNRRFSLTYDAASGRYLDATNANNATSATDEERRRGNDGPFQKCYRFLHSAFVPEGVSPSYYNFVRWRILQRFVNANVHVIGTQSLLMGLRGMQRRDAAAGSAVVAAAAATNWVLKDTLGKVARMAWASKMGRKFDPDAKRWRFRASLVYALGNGLEVCTYLRPRWFLALAMLANSCKQTSMLTSSATRNALYNSFRGEGDRGASAAGGGNSTVVGNRRGSGGVENIGDITAKGEAQIAVVDLLGIASGIYLTRAVGVSVQNVFAVWVILQIMEIFCMYHEMRSVVHKTFNFERMYTVLGRILLDENESDVTNDGIVDGEASAGKQFKFTGHIPTPEQIAAEEKVFLPPDHLARRAIAFGSPGRTLLDPEELDMLINDVFRGEKYFLVVGQDVKNQRGLSARVRQFKRWKRGLSGDDPQEQCHIVLHADANNLDILKSALALVILRKKLARNAREERDAPALRSRDCMDALREAGREAGDIFPQFLRELTKRGWRPPLRSMLGRVSARAEWAIQRK